MLIKFFLLYFFRHRLRVFLFILGVLISLVISFSIQLIYVNINSYYTSLQDSYKLSDVTLIAKDTPFNDTHLEEILKIKNVRAVEGAVQKTYFIDDITVVVLGMRQNPQVNTLPNFNWYNFSGKVAVIDKALSDRLSLEIGDTIELFDENFTIISITSAPWLPSYQYVFMGGILVPLNELKNILNYSGYNILFICLNKFEELPATVYDIYQRINVDFDIKITTFPIAQIVESFSPLVEISRLLVMFLAVSIIIAFVFLNLISASKDLGVVYILGANKFRIITELIISITLIFIAISFMAIGISRIIVTIFWEKALNFTSPEISVPLMDILLILSSYILLYSIGTVILALAIIKKGYVEIISKGIIIGGGRTPKIPNPLLKIPVSNLFEKRLKTLSILIVIIIAIAVPATFSTIAYNVPKEFESDIKYSVKADLMLVFSGPINSTILDEVNRLSKKVEKILYYVLPVYEIGSDEITVQPPLGFISVFAVQGNETLLNIPINGKLIDERVVVSEKILKTFDLEVGKNLNMWVINPTDKALLRIQIPISGYSNFNWFGGWYVIFNYSYLSKEFKLFKNAILVKTDNKEELVARVKQLGFDGEIISFEEMVHAVKDLYSSSVYPFIEFINTLIILGSITGIGVISFYDVSLSKREILILKAIGGSSRTIIYIFFMTYFIYFTISILLALLVYNILSDALISVLNESLLPLWIDTKRDYLTFMISVIRAGLILSFSPIIARKYYSKLTLRETDD